MHFATYVSAALIHACHPTNECQCCSQLHQEQPVDLGTDAGKYLVATFQRAVLVRSPELSVAARVAADASEYMILAALPTTTAGQQLVGGIAA